MENTWKERSAPQMRTIKEAMREIKQKDPHTAFSETRLRKLINSGTERGAAVSGGYERSICRPGGDAGGGAENSRPRRAGSAAGDRKGGAGALVPQRAGTVGEDREVRPIVEKSAGRTEKLPQLGLLGEGRERGEKSQNPL